MVTIAGLKHQSGSINVSAMGSQLQPLKKLKQTDLTTHVFQGIDIPFSPGETAAIEAQALWATVMDSQSLLIFQTYCPGF